MFENLLQRVKEADVSGELQTSNARLLDAAIVPKWPVWPRKRLNLVGVATRRLRAGDRPRAGARVPQAQHQDGRRYRRSPAASAAWNHAQDSSVARETSALSRRSTSLPPAFREALGAIRTRILLSASTADLRALAITSTSAGEGKTLIASNLAISVALTGRRVLLVDADMRRPRLHRMFELPRTPGLADVMATDAGVTSTIRESSIQDLFVLPAGSALASPSDLLDTDRFRFLVRELTGIFDLVVLDCPPVMAVADASIIANAAGAGLFVVGAGVTSREVAQAAIDRLSAQAHVIGVVLNRADTDQHPHSYDYYDYHQDDDTSAQPPESDGHRKRPVDAVLVD